MDDDATYSQLPTREKLVAVETLTPAANKLPDTTSPPVTTPPTKTVPQLSSSSGGVRTRRITVTPSPEVTTTAQKNVTDSSTPTGTTMVTRFTSGEPRSRTRKRTTTQTVTKYGTSRHTRNSVVAKERGRITVIVTKNRSQNTKRSTVSVRLPQNLTTRIRITRSSHDRQFTTTTPLPTANMTTGITQEESTASTSLRTTNEKDMFSKSETPFSGMYCSTMLRSTIFRNIRTHTLTYILGLPVWCRRNKVHLTFYRTRNK